MQKERLFYTDEYHIYGRLTEWGYPHHTVCFSAGEFARDEDGDGFCEVHVNTIEGFWSLLRSWLRPHRGVSQEKLPLYLGLFEFVHNVRKRGKALPGGGSNCWSRQPPETQDEPRLDAQCKALVLVGCLDEIFFHGRPVLVGVEPASMVWFMGKRVGVLRGSIWAEQLQA